MDASSDASSGSGADSAADEQVVCRDFLRNVCRRGRRCKFPHPPDEPGEAAPPPLSRPELLTFCHDYQNGQCVRPTCRFVHCDRADMEVFRRTGGLPTHLLESAVKRGADIRVGPHEVPVCKDFARGECSRGAKCKYRHLSLAELEQQLLCSGSVVAGGGGNVDVVVDAVDPCEPPEAKRRHFDDYSRRGVVVRDYRQAPLKHEPNPHSIIDYRLIEDENRILQRRIQELQKQVDDLTTTNEFLLDQNAQMRMAKLAQSVSGVTSLTTVTVPAVTMAGPISQPMVAAGGTTQMVTVPGNMAAVPVSLAHTPGSTATIAVSLAPVSMHQPGGVVSMASINPAAASMASIANQVTMALNQSNINQQSGSMGSINQATMATIGQQQNAAASMASINQATMASMNQQQQQQQNAAAAASMANINQANLASINAMGPSMGSINQPGVAASMPSMNPMSNNMDQATIASMNPMAASMNPMAAASIQQPVAVASMASINTAAAAAAAQVNAQVACSMSGGSVVSYPLISQLRPILSSNLTQ